MNFDFFSNINVVCPAGGIKLVFLKFLETNKLTGFILNITKLRRDIPGPGVQRYPLYLFDGKNLFQITEDVGSEFVERLKICEHDGTLSSEAYSSAGLWLFDYNDGSPVAVKYGATVVHKIPANSNYDKDSFV